MLTVIPGHIYVPNYYDNVLEGGGWKQDLVPIQFMHRVGEKFPGNTGDPFPGTNCQEVLRILIDRVKYLDNQIPCVENTLILENLRQAIRHFEERACRRRGEVKKIPSNDIESRETCYVCGHLLDCGCEGKL